MSMLKMFNKDIVTIQLDIPLIPFLDFKTIDYLYLKNYLLYTISSDINEIDIPLYLQDLALREEEYVDISKTLSFVNEKVLTVMNEELYPYRDILSEFFILDLQIKKLPSRFKLLTIWKKKKLIQYKDFTNGSEQALSI